MNVNSCFNGHAIVGGYGHLGRRIVDQLLERGCKVTVIQKDADDHVSRRAVEDGFTLVNADIRDEQTLMEAGIKSAGCFIIVTGDDRANLEAAIEARQINKDTPIVIRLYDQELARRVESLINVRALSASFLASPAYVASATDDSIVSVFDVDSLHLGIYSECCNKSRLHGSVVIKDGENLRLADNTEAVPPSARCLYAVIQEDSPRQKRRVAHRKKRHSFTGHIRYLLRQLNPVHLFEKTFDIWNHATAVTQYVFLALVAIGFLSVLIFSVIGKMSLFNSVYLVVTAMTATGFGDIDVSHTSIWLKAYGVIMMLSGAALMATIYAIITDYILTARMEYLLGRREVNLRDHTVVVGLGHVGFRVANDLKAIGVDVAAIESSEDSDNLHAARLMFPVIVGDASRASVLQKAGIERAGVLAALTDDTMLNFSIAVKAKETNPGIKVVVRTYELDLADKLKRFGLDDVISTSAIAAPVFVDSALLPGIQGSFKCDGDRVIVACRTVTGESPLVGRSIKDVGEKDGIAVVMITDSSRSRYRLASPEDVLSKGCKVVILLSHTRLSENDFRERC